ncbi:protein farnesyltransferase/geranylgeranyltransferase type-1 subunit alpha [Nematocida sp. LUAm3]|nr:protein farnesyltransferase/geranylgeranyltransferase type-1 subunit alpha [Nematocida sp. LUAm3]KAI5175672.1 protein farnesyltransferase/geranylgeranyltransferase type-1 subunit alpha [Nematocida sp. LUAm2]KAI5178578.1 protein farnesyltransferase/geranylgeranyltransferase type-1 subunit alpha [Nematocida sp. LUAm1]
MPKETLQFTHDPVYLLNIEIHWKNMKNNVYTKEALNLLDLLLYYSSTNYTLWADRRIVLENIEKKEYSLEEELTWIKEMTKENQKNYQVWNHFLYIVFELKYDILQDADIVEITNEEPKNIHFWGFFLLCVSSFSDLSQALDFTKKYIEKDIRNNSAYCIRYSLLEKYVESLQEEEKEALIQKEKDFLIGISLLKHNLSFWNYVHAIDKEWPSYNLQQSCADALKERVFKQQNED